MSKQHRLRFIASICLVLLVSCGGYLFHFAMSPGPELLRLPVEEPNYIYPLGVSTKFSADGNVRHYAGNTIISHLSPSSEPELYNSMLALHDKLKNSHLSHLYALLPPSSWHMTVLGGVLDEVREPGLWPDDLSINATLEECTSLYMTKLSSFDLQCDPPYRISITGFDPLKIGIGVHLEPYTAEENVRIRGLRDRLSKLLRIRSKDHDTFGFHFSMAYLLRVLTKDQEKKLRKLLMDHFEDMPKQFELGAPEFCTFENMFAYEPLLYLKSQKSQYPVGVPDKFDPDGNVQHYPGNTIITHLSPTSELFDSMLALYDTLKNSPLSHLYALLPPSSWHMTIFEGVIDKVREPSRWPDDLPLNASLEECNSLYQDKLSSFDLQSKPPYHMSIMGFSPLVTGISLHLEPFTPNENVKMRNLRDRLSDVLHIRAKGHETYGFHMSMAYLLRWLTEEQERELTKLLEDHFEGNMPKQFELGSPEFCTFEDMFEFTRRLYLKPQYPSGVPYRFDPDGNVQHYPGNTIISHLSPSSEPELHSSLLALSSKLENSPLSHLWTVLPSSSWHMTVFDGVLDQVREPGRWPDDLPLNASLEECTSLYRSKLSSFDLQSDPPYHLSIIGFKRLRSSISLHLEPYTSEENARMRLLRDRLSDALHIRKEDHLTYGFHLTIGYLLRFLTKDQEKELRTLLTDHFKGMPKQFQLGAPEFCTFEDMFAYEPLLYLKTRYPSGVPYKFGPDGSVQHYPGNTIISHLSPSSESGLHDSLLALSGKLQSSPLGHLYALLPSTSWHMTIFDGVLDQVRKPGRWPDDISLNASLEECTALYQNKLSSFDLQCDPPYHMSIKGFKPLEGTIGLHLEPYTTEEDAQMRDLRDRLSDTLHIRKEDQTTYGFYLTLGYLLRFLTEQQEKELNKLLYDHFESMPKQFALGGPEFCTFENMYSFTPLVYLTDQ